MEYQNSFTNVNPSFALAWVAMFVRRSYTSPSKKTLLSRNSHGLTSTVAAAR